MLRRKPLSIEDLGEFSIWKRDLQKTCTLMLLSGERHWATVNRLIATRLDQDVHVIVVNLFPENAEELAALDPEVLLQQIEERLITTDQTEQRRLRFKLAKQVLEKNPWTYENCLQRYYDEAHLQDEKQFVDIFTRGVYNKELWKLLLLHELPLTSIEPMKKVT